jgi:hypothetical protein
MSNALPVEPPAGGVNQPVVARKVLSEAYAPPSLHLWIRRRFRGVTINQQFPCCIERSLVVGLNVVKVLCSCELLLSLYTNMEEFFYGSGEKSFNEGIPERGGLVLSCRQSL